MTAIEKTFTFWKDNRTDGEYQMTVSQLKVKFFKWMKTKEKDWLAYYSAQLVKIFIGDKTGLSSAFNLSDFDDMNQAMIEAKWEYLNSIGIK